MILDGGPTPSLLTEATEPAASALAVPAATERTADLRLARLHLRTGSFGLARAELEAAAEDAPLQGRALLDLAEASWRTGDLAGAGRAAETWLDAGGRDPLGTIIAVEAAMAEGRPTDARLRLQAVTTPAPEELDAAFNGMPRSAVWPAEIGPAAVAGAVELARDGVGSDREVRRGGGQAASADLDPVAELEAARADIEAGEVHGAAVRLSVALRLAPHLAPAVLDLVEGVAGSMLDLVRGDAYRLVGRETEAERAWRTAAADLPSAPLARGGRAGTRGGTAPSVAFPADTRPASAGRAREPGASAPELEETP